MISTISNVQVHANTPVILQEEMKQSHNVRQLESAPDRSNAAAKTHMTFKQSQASDNTTPNMFETHIVQSKRSRRGLTVENFVELSRGGVDDEVSCYAYLQNKDKKTKAENGGRSSFMKQALTPDMTNLLPTDAV